MEILWQAIFFLAILVIMMCELYLSMYLHQEFPVLIAKGYIGPFWIKLDTPGLYT